MWHRIVLRFPGVEASENKPTMSAIGRIIWMFGGEPAELLHGPLLIDLVSFLNSDSPLFLGRKTTRRRSRLQV